MTFFAEIKNGIVVNVIVATQEEINKNYSGLWVETFIESNNNPKKNYAGINYTLDIDGDFVTPKPIIKNVNHESFLDVNTKRYTIRDKITKEAIDFTKI